MAAGTNHTCAVISNVTTNARMMKCWATLNTGGFWHSNRPADFNKGPANPTDVIARAWGIKEGTCVWNRLDSAGKVTCFGQPFGSELDGQGTSAPWVIQAETTLGFPPSTGAIGGDHTCFASDSGVNLLKCMGNPLFNFPAGYSYQPYVENYVTNATAEAQTHPTFVLPTGLSQHIQIAESGANVCALATNGTVYCQGPNRSGLFGKSKLRALADFFGRSVRLDACRRSRDDDSDCWAYLARHPLR